MHVPSSPLHLPCPLHPHGKLHPIVHPGPVRPASHISHATPLNPARHSQLPDTHSPRASPPQSADDSHTAPSDIAPPDPDPRPLPLPETSSSPPASISHSSPAHPSSQMHVPSSPLHLPCPLHPSGKLHSILHSGPARPASHISHVTPLNPARHTQLPEAHVPRVVPPHSASVVQPSVRWSDAAAGAATPRSSSTQTARRAARISAAPSP